MALRVSRSRVLAGSAAALALPVRPLRAQTAAKVRIGIAPAESFMQAAFAQEAGFLRQAGIDADVQLLANGATVTAALLGGALDIGVTNGGSMANAHIRGLPIYCIAPSGLYTSSSPTTGLIVAKNSPITSARDLDGKRLAVTGLRDLMQAAVVKWIDDNGGDSKSVSFPELRVGDVLPAIVANRVDAAAMTEPTLTDSRDAIRVLAYPYDAVAKTLMISGFIVQKSWYDANTATAQRFVQVMRQTAEWANKNRRPSAEIVAKYTKVPLETVLKMNHVLFATALDPAVIQPVIDVSARYGYIPRSFPAAELFPPRSS
jgi:NitT/TauT family transport system substrate-binding protein